MKLLAHFQTYDSFIERGSAAMNIMANHIHGIIAIVGVPLVGIQKTIGDSPSKILIFLHPNFAR